MSEEKKVSRRKFIAIGAGIVAVAAAAGGAYYLSQPGRSPPAPTTTATSAVLTSATTSAAPTYPTVLLAQTVDAASLDPALGWEITSMPIFYNCYDHLLDYDVNKLKDGIYELTPTLAESWTPSEDGITHTFKLRDDAYFSNGDKVTADDVKWSIDRHIRLQGPNAYLLDGPISEVKAVDAQTVQIVLKSVDVSFPYILAGYGHILNRKLVEGQTVGDDNGSPWLQNNSAGSGPLVLTGWERRQRIELVRNDKYWGLPKPSIGKLVIRDIAEPTDMQLALEKGDVDIADGLLLQQVDTFKDNPGFQVLSLPTNVNIYLGMNNFGPLKDLKVRKAIAQAINYDEIVSQLLNGRGEILQSIVVKGIPGYQPDLAYYYKYNPETSKQLLAEAGLKDGFEVELVHGTGVAYGGIMYQTIATKLQSDLGKVGINVKIRELAWPTLYDLYRGGKLEGLIVNYVGWSYPDPDESISWIPTSLFEKRIRFKQTDEVNQLVAKQKTILDPKERENVVRQIQEIVLRDQLFYLSIYQPKVTIVMRSNIGNLAYNPWSYSMVWKLAKKS